MTIKPWSSQRILKVTQRSWMPLGKTILALSITCLLGNLRLWIRKITTRYRLCLILCWIPISKWRLFWYKGEPTLTLQTARGKLLCRSVCKGSYINRLTTCFIKEQTSISWISTVLTLAITQSKTVSPERCFASTIVIGSSNSFRCCQIWPIPKSNLGSITKSNKVRRRSPSRRRAITNAWQQIGDLVPHS